MPLGIGVEQVPGLGHRGLVPDRGHHVLQRAAFGRVVVNVIGGEQAEAMGAGQRVQSLDPGNIVAPVEIGGGDVAQGRQLAGEVRDEVGERQGPLVIPAKAGIAVGKRSRIRSGTTEGDDVALNRDRKPRIQIIRRQQDQLHALACCDPPASPA